MEEMREGGICVGKTHTNSAITYHDDGAFPQHLARNMQVQRKRDVRCREAAVIEPIHLCPAAPYHRGSRGAEGGAVAW